MLVAPLLAALCFAAACRTLNVVACRKAVEDGVCVSGSFGTCKDKAEKQTARNVVHAQSQCVGNLGTKLSKGYEPLLKRPATEPSTPSGAIRSLRKIDWPRGKDKALRITTPGRYRLEESIVFDFQETNPSEVSPLQWDNVIGIAIEVSGVELDLNGHTLSMSDRFLRRQRFWNHIQLNNLVFRPFGGLYTGDLLTPNDIIIRNGKLGQSSHMGIQGIENGRVLIEDLSIQEFEVAGISCKNCRDVTIRRCSIDNTNLKVPLNVDFSELWMNFRWVHQNQDIIRRDQLMRRAWSDFSQPSMRTLLTGTNPHFAAKDGLPQGSIFGIQLKMDENKSERTPLSERAVIDTVTIKNMKNGQGSRVGMSLKGEPIICQNGNALDYNGYFNEQGIPKQVNGMSLDVVIFRTCVITGGDKMPRALKRYVSQGSTVNIFTVSMDNDGSKLRKFFGSDVRGHSPAGAFGIRVQRWSHVLIQNVKIDGVSNGETGAAFGTNRKNSVMLLFDSEFPAVWQSPKASQSVFKMANGYGVALDSVTRSFLHNVEVKNVESKVGLAFGVAVGGKSSVTWLDEINILNVAVADPKADRELPFLKQKAMPLFIEEGTKDVALGVVNPVSAWFAPTTPDFEAAWEDMKALDADSCERAESLTKLKKAADNNTNETAATTVLILLVVTFVVLGACCGIYYVRSRRRNKDQRPPNKSKNAVVFSSAVHRSALKSNSTKATASRKVMPEHGVKKRQTTTKKTDSSVISSPS